MNKETKIQIIVISILLFILCCLVYLTKKEFDGYNNIMFNNKSMEETKEKETKKDDVSNGFVVTTSSINLNDYNSNISIINGGEYNIEGSFNYSIIVNSSETVTLNLNNVEINSNITAALANINSGELIINLVDNSTNILKDNGSSEYDGCIYSLGKLTINGNGILKVYGNQEEGEGIATESNDITINSGEIYIEANDDGLNAGGDGGIITINGGNIFIKATGDGIDSNKTLIINGGYIYTMGSSIGGDAGIDTDDGFVINGGEVIALGSDMLEIPMLSSQQKYISFSLKNKISDNSIISLKDSEYNEIVSFEAKEDFKTLIISNKNLISGTYYLFVNDKQETQGTIK